MLQIPSLARHAVRLYTVDDSAVLTSEQALGDDRAVAEHTNAEASLQGEQPPAAPLLSPRSARAVAGMAPETLFACFDATTQVERRLCLPVGTNVFFRSEDCGRWTREMLHGAVVHDDSVRASSDTRFYYRVVWLRGVAMLPNGFFRASLELQAPPSDRYVAATGTATAFGTWWPLEIGIFPSQLGAFRAVVTAEAIARMKFLREQVSGRLVAGDFPSALVMNEILEETDAVLGAEFRVRLSKRDDVAFLRDIGRGAWDYRAWMRSIGREQQLKEEDATTLAASSSTLASDRVRRNTSGDRAGSTQEQMRALPWQPATRIRFFLIEQRELLFPEHVQRQHLAAIMAQMLRVYIGFAWQRWRKFVQRSRRHELRQHRHHGATRIQMWMRRLTTQWANEASGARPEDAPLLALQLYQRRQAEAAKLYAFMSQQYREKQRSALQRWAAAARIEDPDVRRRLDVREQTRWHPSYGIAALPKLPKSHAHKRSDGSLAVDDMKLYKQFRASHAGPTDMSYWVVRGRVLVGVYPIGRSFRDARRIVARADYTTSVLLQEISAFVCLAESSELEALEQAETTNPSVSPASNTELSPTDFANTEIENVHLPLQTSTNRERDHQQQEHHHQPRTVWLFERVVRSKYDALQSELRAAVKLSLRQVQLAQLELREHEATSTTSDASELDDTLATKLALAQQNAEKARKALETLTMELRFEHFPIPKDGVPDAHALEAFLVRVEDLLRMKRNVYVFSMNGHGRTGFIAALLLGRLYGISSLHALELAQRLHDCKWSMHSVPSNRSTSSPKATVQVAGVQRLLAHWDTIYAPITSENSAVGFHEQRAQQRGIAADPFLTKDGFMISSKPDADAASAQRQTLRLLQRIAVRESGAAQLVRARKRETAARQAMEREDRSSRQLQQLLARRASIATMELAMVGEVVTATLDDLVLAVKTRLTSAPATQTSVDVDSAVSAAIEALVERAIEASIGGK